MAWSTGAGPIVATAVVLAGMAQAAPGSEAFMERFRAVDPGRWYIFDNFAYGDALNDTAWSRWNVLQVGPSIELKLESKPAFGKSNTGGQLHTHRYGHGRYEVIMQPARGSGIVSAFFTYIGPDSKKPHDEIDFEFLGKDTKTVSVNYFKNGNGKHGKTVELGFDAAEAAHIYAFEWTATAIRWYVDDKLVHSVSGDAASLPVTPGNIYVQIWGGGPPARDWLGPIKYESPVFARYQCVSFVPEGGSGAQCSDGSKQ